MICHCNARTFLFKESASVFLKDIVLQTYSILFLSIDNRLSNLFLDDSPRIIHIQGSKFRILRLEDEGVKEVFGIDANKECLSEIEEVCASNRRERRAKNPLPPERLFLLVDLR